MEAWDELFNVLHECTLRFAPLVHHMLYEVCDLRPMGFIGGHFDGPRAWRILDSRISATERTKADKQYDSLTVDQLHTRALTFSYVGLGALPLALPYSQLFI